ncbi:MAG: hypothetical protein ACM4AI_01165 [Acidobacteriota bacterium]
MTSTHEWERWEARWRAVHASPSDLDLLLERARQARRRVAMVHRLATAIALTAIAVVGAALRHAGNGFEITLGILVAGGIVVVWILDRANRRRSVEVVDAPEGAYRAARIALCVRQERFAWFGWIVVGLDLVFLFPWWIGGVEVHGAGFRLGQILTVWLPLATMAGFVAWTIRLRAKARAELAQLTRQTRASDL